MTNAGKGAPVAELAPYYINPLATGSWVLARTDQGVDYQPQGTQPVLAIGKGKVLRSTMGSGWPGGGFFSYQLLEGPCAGNIVFVAEHLTGGMPSVGTTLAKGQHITNCLEGYPWSEWGWADSAGYGPYVRYGGSADGTPMSGGKAFARFMRLLGAGSRDDPGPGWCGMPHNGIQYPYSGPTRVIPGVNNDKADAMMGRIEGLIRGRTAVTVGLSKGEPVGFNVFLHELKAIADVIKAKTDKLP